MMVVSCFLSATTDKGRRLLWSWPAVLCRKTHRTGLLQQHKRARRTSICMKQISFSGRENLFMTTGNNTERECLAFCTLWFVYFCFSSLEQGYKKDEACIYAFFFILVILFHRILKNYLQRETWATTESVKLTAPLCFIIYLYLFWFLGTLFALSFANISPQLNSHCSRKQPDTNICTPTACSWCKRSPESCSHASRFLEIKSLRGSEKWPNHFACNKKKCIGVFITAQTTKNHRW